MAEALAVAASIIAIIQISDRVISLCGQFMGRVRGHEREVAQMITTITSLKGFLEFIQKFVENEANASQLPLLSSLMHPNGLLKTCTTLLEDMEAKMRPPKRDYNGILKTITWPWKWDDIARALEIIEKQKTLILLSMQGDTTRATITIENRVNDIHHHVKDDKCEKIHRWLTKTDPISNHTAACAKHEPGTGVWFTSSHQFSYWLLPGRSLWLHGIPGAGKTILCSTIIENLKSRCSAQVPCVYYYFDFSNPQKQKVVNLLCSFLAQLSSSSIPLEVHRLYENCNHGNRDPTMAQLIDTFLSIIDKTKQTYIIIDALDESSKSDRQSLFEVITTLQTHDKINLLMTSRQESDIQNKLQDLMDYVVPIENEKVDDDINMHVEKCLQNDPILSKWNIELKLKISSTLTSKAHEM